MKGICNSCGNEEWLYVQNRTWACMNCIDLGNAHGRMRARNPIDPINQPGPLTTAAVTRKPCVWCATSTPVTYRWPGVDPHGVRNTVIYACGWGCAGFWMDAQTEAQRVIEDEAYVRQSLGMEEV